MTNYHFLIYVRVFRIHMALTKTSRSLPSSTRSRSFFTKLQSRSAYVIVLVGAILFLLYALYHTSKFLTTFLLHSDHVYHYVSFLTLLRRVTRQCVIEYLNMPSLIRNISLLVVVNMSIDRFS